MREDGTRDIFTHYTSGMGDGQGELQPSPAGKVLHCTNMVGPKLLPRAELTKRCTHLCQGHAHSRASPGHGAYL